MIKKHRFIYILSQYSIFFMKMQSFQDQMNQIRADLKSGLTQLENVNNNAETAGKWI